MTALTVSMNESEADNAPSLTVTVITAVPDCPALGVTVTVRALGLVAPVPKLMLETRFGLDELPVTLRLDADVSGSLIVKEIGPAAPPSLIV